MIRTHQQLRAEVGTSSALDKVQRERAEVQSVPCSVGSDIPQDPKLIVPLGQLYRRLTVDWSKDTDRAIASFRVRWDFFNLSHEKRKKKIAGENYNEKLKFH